MLTISRFPRQIRGLLLLGICLLVLSALPVVPAAAAKVTLRLDDKLSQFIRGNFQRTSLSAYPNPSTQTDEKGAVQTIPVSVIKNWERSGFLLPKKLTDLGAASIGNTIFVLGGQAWDGITDPAPTNEVWSVVIDPANGQPTTSAWFNEAQDLPNVQHSDLPLYTAFDARRTLMAVTAVATGDDSGYIYVIGGRVKPVGAPLVISSYAVSIGTVAGGHITGWVSSNTTNLASLRIPTDGHAMPWGLNGLQSASVVSRKIGNTTYIYLIGGLERFPDGGAAHEIGSNQVYYAKVGTDGMLVKPSNGAIGWDTLAPLPIPTPAQNAEIITNISGLWDATAVAGTFEFGAAPKDVLYVIGGQYQSEAGNGSALSVYSSAIYRAFIGSDGKLTWTSAAGLNQWEGTLSTARVGMGGEEVFGKLYLTGGQTVLNNAPQGPEAAVLTSFVKDDFKLLSLGANDTGPHFIYQSDALRQPISPRTHHGSVKIQTKVIDKDAAAPAYIYVIGGQGTELNGSDTLIFAKVGGDEATSAVGFASSGWYYSTVQQTTTSYNGEQVQEIDWTTLMTDTAAMDIEMQYRTSTDNECSNPAALNNAAWVDMDGLQGNPKRSKTGANAHLLGVPPPAHCFEYRARLVNGTGDIQPTTPLLLNVSIQVIIPGSPDLQVQTLKDLKNAKGQFTGLNVQLLNHYDSTDKRYPTQSADVDQKGGSFFVDLFVFGPGQTPVKPVPPWQTNPTGDKACAVFPKSQMPIGAQITVARWYNVTDSSCEHVPIDILTLFPQPGAYTVFVVVDSYDCSLADTVKGCVDESSPGAEGNNVAQLNVTITSKGYPDIQLPIIRK